MGINSSLFKDILYFLKLKRMNLTIQPKKKGFYSLKLKFNLTLNELITGVTPNINKIIKIPISPFPHTLHIIMSHSISVKLVY